MPAASCIRRYIHAAHTHHATHRPRAPAGLDTFRLEGTDAVTDDGWRVFADSHSHLTRLDLVRCPRLTDMGFILSIRQLPRLARIGFVDCPGIDMSALAALLSFCPRLEHMEVQVRPCRGHAFGTPQGEGFGSPCMAHATRCMEALLGLRRTDRPSVA